MTSRTMRIPLVALALSLALTAGSMAEEVKLTSTISSIQLAADGTSATVAFKAADGKEIQVLVKDEITLDKFKDKRIVPGDEVRVKYDNTDGKNITRLMRKTAGC